MSIVFISEITYDVVGTDSGEAIEIMAPENTDLTGWSVVLYNGSTPGAATVYNTRVLDGMATNLGGGQGVFVITYRADGIQNGGNDAIALVDPYGNVVQFISYEGIATASNGPAAGLTSVNIGVSQTNTTPLGQSVQLTGTGSDSADFTWAASAAGTFGANNTGMTYDGPGQYSFDATAGDDIDFEGTYGIDIINGLDGNDVIRALWGDDTVDGGAGNDVLQGMRGADILIGGAGNDIYAIDDAGDIVEENAGEGIDEVRSIFDIDLSSAGFANVENARLQGTATNLTGSTLNNTLRGNALDNIIDAGAGNDLVYGGAGADTINGGMGNDTLRGDAGMDMITGGAGRDIMFGGADADTFAFATGDFAGLTLGTADWVRDFSQADGDVLSFDFVGNFIGNAAFSGAAGEVRYQAAGPNTMIFIDADGDMAADYAVRLTGIIEMAAGDFQFTVAAP